VTRARESLRREVGRLAVEGASRLIGREIDPRRTPSCSTSWPRGRAWLSAPPSPGLCESCVRIRPRHAGIRRWSQASRWPPGGCGPAIAELINNPSDDGGPRLPGDRRGGDRLEPGLKNFVRVLAENHRCCCCRKLPRTSRCCARRSRTRRCRGRLGGAARRRQARSCDSPRQALKARCA